MAREPGDAEDKLDRVASLFAAARRQTARPAPQSLSAALIACLGHWDDLAHGRAAPGLTTHLPTLDRALAGGLKGGRVIVLAARPSVGKTSLAAQIALNIAADGNPVLVLSQEMQAGDLVDRAVANLGRVSLDAITTGKFGGDDWSRITEAAEAAQRSTTMA